MRSSLSRRDVVAGLSLTAGIAAVMPAWARPPDSGLTFLAVGDWGRDGASHQRDVAGQMGLAAHRAGCRFIVSTGDNFYENGVQSARDPQWESSFERIYTAPSLQLPWYAVLGNHDYRGVPQAQIDYAIGSGRWRMPARYYRVAGSELGLADADLFFLDTSPLVHKYRDSVEGAIAMNVATQDVEAQLAWLDQELARSQAPWKIVFGHHTIYSGGSAHGNTVELVAQVMPLLERHGVQVYINGHEHDLQHIRVRAVDYICAGAGSETRPTGLISGLAIRVGPVGICTDDARPKRSGPSIPRLQGNDRVSGDNRTRSHREGHVTGPARPTAAVPRCHDPARP